MIKILSNFTTSIFFIYALFIGQWILAIGIIIVMILNYLDGYNRKNKI